MKQIIVLGGGYGGVLTAKKLANHLRKQRDVKITLIDRKPYHTLLTELHEVAANRVEEDAIKIDFNKIFAGYRNVDVVMDNISDINFDNHSLQGEKQTYRFDYLVIGTGSKPTFFGIPGADEHAFTLWSYEDAIRLKAHIRTMFQLAEQELNPQARKAMLTFVVVGGGFTGVEMMGDLAEYTVQLCREFHIAPQDVNLELADMVKQILPVLPDKLVRKAEKYLQRQGVNIRTNAAITAVGPESVTVGGEQIASRTVIWTAGVEGSEIVGELDVEQKGRKRVQVNDKLQIPAYSNVYVVGDNMFYIPEGATNPVPQMVENAELAAPIIAWNITAAINNKPMKSYKPTFHGMMVSIGSKYGVARVGVPGRMMKFSGRFAIFVKHLINMLYLFQVCGFNKVYHYFLHEFIHVRDNRSIAGGHLAKRSPNFWLLPLRLFVGGMWLYEGLGKLGKVLENPNDIFLIPAKIADGTTGASVAAEGAEQAIEALPVPGFVQSMVESSMNLMFYNSDGGYTSLATIFQFGMVCAEIAVGLLLIVGLFTALAAIVSVAMGVMIWSSGMASREMLWYMAAGIALIGGSGSAFGLDYYVYPRLKRVWKRIPLVRRWYLYTD